MVRERKGNNPKTPVKTAVVAEDVDMEAVNGNSDGNISKVNGQISDKPLGQREKMIKPTTPTKKQNASSSSLSVLLTQGIMANDSAKIDAVLRNMQYDVIFTTVREMQPMHVLPLLKLLEVRLRTRNSVDIRPTIRWAQVVMSVHMPYLCSLPNLEKELCGLFSWLRARVGHQQDLLMIHGKISTIADQIKKRSNNVSIVQQPLVVFNNDVDSESDDFDTIGSDDDGESSEDDWWDDSELKQDEQENDAEEDDEESDDDEDNSDNDDDDDDDDEDRNDSDTNNDNGDDSNEEVEDEDMEVG